MISHLLNLFRPKRRPRCYELVGALALRYEQELKMLYPQIYIFEAAADEWGFSRSKIKADFEEYLRSGCVPRYVKNYCKKRVTDEDLKLYSMYQYKVG